MLSRCSGLTWKAGLLITVMVTVFAILFTIFYLTEKRESLEKEKQLQLLTVAGMLERQLDNAVFQEDAVKVNALSISQDEKALMMNKLYQPVLMAIAEQYPDYGFGIYSKEIDRIVAIGPLFDPAKLRQVIAPDVMQIYETKTPFFGVRETTSIGWPGKPIYFLTYPIALNGQIIGHTWSSVKTEDVSSGLLAQSMKIIGWAVVLWLVSLAGLYLILSKLHWALDKLAIQVQSKNDTRDSFQSFPELLSILDTIIALREEIHDIYQVREKNREELVKLDRLNLIGEMAAGVAHEIRNPLTVISGYIQLMSRQAEDNAKSQYALILEELSRIEDIITDFLSIARNKRVEKKRCKISDIVEGLSPLLNAEALKQGVDLELQLQRDLPPNELDRSEIKQLILNLARNAMEAMGKGNQETTRNIKKLTIKTELDVTNAVRLSVIDTGRGIARELLGKIYDPFYSSKEMGTGLGLSICRGIVERHDGQIRAESEVGVGTAIIVTLPTIESASNENFRDDSWRTC